MRAWFEPSLSDSCLREGFAGNSAQLSKGFIIIKKLVRRKDTEGRGSNLRLHRSLLGDSVVGGSPIGLSIHFQAKVLIGWEVELKSFVWLVWVFWDLNWSQLGVTR